MLKQHQQQADGVVLYFTRNGQHVHSIDLSDEHRSDGVDSTRDLTMIDMDFSKGPSCSLRQLPHNLQGLSKLKFTGLKVQLQPADGHQGVVPPRCGSWHATQTACTPQLHTAR